MLIGALSISKGWRGHRTLVLSLFLVETLFKKIQPPSAHLDPIAKDDTQRLDCTICEFIIPRMGASCDYKFSDAWKLTVINSVVSTFLVARR